MDIILGYVGYACAGKDTAAKLLKKTIIQHFSNTVTIEDPETLVTGTYCNDNDNELIIWHVPLALEVKREFVAEQAAKDIVIDLRRLLYDSEYKCQFREDLIAIGDGRRNTVHELYWIHKAQKIIEHLRQQHPSKKHIFQVTDMRYHNEIPEFETFAHNNKMSMLSTKLNTRLEVLITRMTRSGLVDFMRVHRLNNSERNIKRIEADIMLDNNKTIKHLQKQIQMQILPLLGLILFQDEHAFGKKPSILKRLLAGLANLYNTYL